MVQHISIPFGRQAAIHDDFNGVGPWAFEFPFFEDSDLVVVANGVETTAYTLVRGPELDGGYVGGSITLHNPPVGIQKIVIDRKVSPGRTVDFSPAGANASAINSALDRLHAIVQDFDVVLGRTLRVPVGETADGFDLTQLQALYDALVSGNLGGGGGGGTTTIENPYVDELKLFLSSQPSIDLTGATSGHRAAIEALAATAATDGRELTGIGTILVDETLDFGAARINLSQVKLQADASLDGPVARIGSDTQNSTRWQGDVYVWGNGNFDFSVFPTADGAMIYDHDSSHGRARVSASYCRTGIIIYGNTEKMLIDASAVYCSIALENRPWGPDGVLLAAVSAGATSATISDTVGISAGLPVIFENDAFNEDIVTISSVNHGTGVITFTPALSFAHAIGTPVGNPGSYSADTLLVNLTAQSCQYWYIEQDNASTSLHIMMEVEARKDPGDGSAAIQIKNGKRTVLGGMCRSFNGGTLIEVDKVSSNGVDTVDFDGLHITHGYGTALHVIRCHRLGGRLHIKDWAPGNGGNATDTPCVLIETLFANDMSLQISDCSNDIGLQLGSFANNRRPDGCTINASIEMGSADAFNSKPPGAHTALKVESLWNSIIDVSAGIHGNIVIGSDIRESTLILPASWLRGGYTMTVDPLAEITIRVVGGLRSDEIFLQPWLSGVVIAEGLDDYNGMSATWANGVWAPSAPLAVTPESLLCLNSDANAFFKKEGLMAFNKTANAAYWASGDTPAASWIAESATTITVGLLAQTSALLARMTVAPNTTVTNGIDRLYWRLIEAGLLAKMGVLYVLGMHDQQAARLSWVNSNNTLTVVGSPAWAQFEGYTGNGVDAKLTTGWAPQFSGISLDSLHGGAFVTSHSTMNTPDLGADNGKLQIRGRATSAAQVAISHTSTTNSTDRGTYTPHHIVGNRVSSTEQSIYANGRIMATGAVDTTDVAGGIPDGVFILGGESPAEYSDRRVFAAHVGHGLTGLEIKRLYIALREFGRTIGATVG